MKPGKTQKTDSGRLVPRILRRIFDLLKKFFKKFFKFFRPKDLNVPDSLSEKKRFLAENSQAFTEEKAIQVITDEGSEGGKAVVPIPFAVSEIDFDDNTLLTEEAQQKQKKALQEIYKKIHAEHQGKKGIIPAFDALVDVAGELSSLVDQHPLLQSAYFSGIDNSKEHSIASENTDPNVRAELKKQLDYKLRLLNEQQNKPGMVPPSPFSR